MIYSTRLYIDQFGFQREFAAGRVLNVGCNTDGAGLGKIEGNVNVDIQSVDSATGNALPVHRIADARALPFQNEFDSVVLGEILEHMEHDDAVQSLREARKALKAGGRVVITMPHDNRRENGALAAPEREWYTQGVHAYHYRKIPRHELFGWISEAGLNPALWARIRYVWGQQGSGVVAC